METSIASFFPHKVNKTDCDECNTLFNLTGLLSSMMMHTLNLTNEGARKFEHYLTIMMWNFILESTKDSSTMLFKIREGYEDNVKMLRNFCMDRHVNFSKQFLHNTFLLGRHDKDFEVTDGKEGFKKVSNDEYDGEKRVKLNEEVKNSSLFTIEKLVEQLTEKFTPGELRAYAFSEAQKAIKLYKQNDYKGEFSIDNAKELILKYFEFTPSGILPQDEQDFDLYLTTIIAILEYLSAEILELGANMAVDRKSKFVFSSHLNGAISMDNELQKTIFYHMNVMPIVDISFFYGFNQQLLPNITIKGIKDSSMIDFCNIPTELHNVILQNFDCLEEVLKMRLVCKRWNYFIMNDCLVWKKLICNSMIAENIFKYCDSTFTVNEMERIMESGKYAKPLYLQQQVINHYFEKNDWKSLYFILVRQHLTFIRDMQSMKSRQFFSEFFKYEFRGSGGYSTYETLFDESSKKLEIGITENIDLYNNFTLYKPQYEKKQEETILIPKDQFETFSKIDSEMYLVAIIDFSKFQSFISCRKFPKCGLLYCFYDFQDKKQFLYFNLTLETLIPFELSEDTFKKPERNSYSVYDSPIQSCIQEQVLVNTDGPSEIYLMQNFMFGTSYSILAPCYNYSFNNECGNINLDVFKNDRIVLYSDTFEIEYVTQTLCISISQSNLERNDFSQTFIDSYEKYI